MAKNMVTYNNNNNNTIVIMYDPLLDSIDRSMCVIYSSKILSPSPVGSDHSHDAYSQNGAVKYSRFRLRLNVRECVRTR